MLTQGELDAGLLAFLGLGIGIGEQPEHHGHDQHGDGIDLWHHPPAIGDHQQRCDQIGDGGAGVAGAENAHRRTLPLLTEPRRGVGNARRERTASQTHEQAEREVLPILRGERQPVNRDGDQNHLNEKDDASAETVGQDAERQPDQRTGQNRRGNQQTEFRFVEIELLLDPNADN